MCVIAIVETVRPSDSMVERMWNHNHDGGGVAWRENGKVKWYKGLDLEAIQGLCRTLPMPYVAHFRLQSVGGLSPTLTHPFPIDDFNAGLDLSGETTGSVLFHNGTWGDWRNVVLNTAINAQVELPDGDWSDTRALAWAAKIYGKAILPIINEKTVIFGPDFLRITNLNAGWKKVDGVYCSNDFFDIKTVTYGGGYQQQNFPQTYSGVPSNASSGSTYTICRVGRCIRRSPLDAAGYCPDHKPQQAVVDGQQDPPSKPVIVRLREAEKEEEMIQAGIIKKEDRTYSKNELKRLRKLVTGHTISPKNSQAGLVN